MKVFNGLVSQTTGDNLIRSDKTNSRSPPATRGQMSQDEWSNFEFAGPFEPFAFRRRKYFSHECQFRIACEAGRLSRPMTHEVSKTVASSRFLQDLQNRYTRAFNYGSLHADCDRYYCVLVKMMGGPAGFASGVAEIINRIVNRDLYEADGYTN